MAGPTPPVSYAFLSRLNFLPPSSPPQVPELPGRRGPIDPDTPDWALTRTSLHDGTELQLVFSDEFNNDGRTFYPGDDPYWEAVDLHYWQTGNLEWYDPAAITTQDGALKITLTKQKSHDLNYQGGMMSSWNQFCFTGGYIEVAVTLPGLAGVAGLWPAIWTMGNLGRAGYGASLEGMVRIIVIPGREPRIDLDPRSFCSGHTPTTLVMLEPFQTKHGKVYRTFRLTLVISTTWVTSRTFRVNGSPVAPVPVSHIPGPSTTTARSLAGPPQKSISSKPRHRVTRVLFPSPASGRRSMQVTSGSTRAKMRSLPTRTSRS